MVVDIKNSVEIKKISMTVLPSGGVKNFLGLMSVDGILHPIISSGFNGDVEIHFSVRIPDDIQKQLIDYCEKQFGLMIVDK